MTIFDEKVILTLYSKCTSGNIIKYAVHDPFKGSSDQEGSCFTVKQQQQQLVLLVSENNGNHYMDKKRLSDV